MARSSGNSYSWSDALEVSTMVVGVIVLVTVLNSLLPFDLRVLGIIPRTFRGLAGILFAPLLHLGFPHLIANAFPLWLLIWVLFSHREYHPERTLAAVWLGSGFGTWLIGRPGTLHIGASSLIYGLVVYLIAAGWWMRSWRSVLVALLVLIFYGGIFYGILPQRGMISWEGHLAGAVTGLLAARYRHA